MAPLINGILGPSGEWRFVRIIIMIFSAAAVIRMIPFHRRRANLPRRRARTSRFIPAAISMVAILTMCGGAYEYAHYSAPRQVIQVAPLAETSTSLVGVFEPSDTASYRPVYQFMKATGTRPAFVLYYSGWNDPFQIRFASWAHAAGAIPFAQIEPDNIRLARIATGHYDSYLRTFARAVRLYGKQVILGFAPEMNGNWYEWGAGHTKPRFWVAAWRHLVTLFRNNGASNVTWLWTVNSVNASRGSLRKWWPGANYVDWIGVDGYYYRPSDTFRSVFGTTIQEVRKLTSKPILISETAIGPSPKRGKQIAGLFKGIRANHLRGLVWFDMKQHDGPYHQDWRLEDSPRSLAAFRSALAISR